MDGEGNIALDVLHSQLYVLKVLSAAMTFRWQCHREEQEAQDDLTDEDMPDSPMSHQKRRTNPAQTTPRQTEWIEPPRLEDAVAKYALSVMVLFLRQTAPVSDRPKTSGHMHSVSFPDFQPPEMASPLPPSIRPQPTASSSVFPSAYLSSRASSNSLRTPGKPLVGRGAAARLHAAVVNGNARVPHSKENGQTNGHHDPEPSKELPSRSLMPSTPLTVSSSPSSINWIISKYAGKIVFHLSSSNWAVVFAKIRNKIHHLAQTNEETPDMVDMKLVACSALDRTKLVQVMQGEKHISSILNCLI